MSFQQTRIFMATMALSLLAMALLATSAQAKPVGPVAGGPLGALATFHHSLATVAATPLPSSATGVTQSAGSSVPWTAIIIAAGAVLLLGLAAAAASRVTGRRPATI
jgi:hypothetical protein